MQMADLAFKVSSIATVPTSFFHKITGVESTCSKKLLRSPVTFGRGEEFPPTTRPLMIIASRMSSQDTWGLSGEDFFYFFPALPIEYETLSVNNWKFERMKRELNAEFSLEKHSNQKHKQTQKTPKQHTSKQTKQKATSNENSQNHVKQSETPRAPSQPLNTSLPPSSNPPSHPCKV